MISWLYLSGAIIFEIIGTTLMKMSDGFTYKLPALGMFVAYICAFSLLALSLKKIEVSVAYAVWAAVGIFLISIVGVLFFKETVSLVKVISMLFIIAGVVGLTLTSSAH